MGTRELKESRELLESRDLKVLTGNLVMSENREIRANQGRLYLEKGVPRESLV